MRIIISSAWVVVIVSMAVLAGVNRMTLHKGEVISEMAVSNNSTGFQFSAVLEQKQVEIDQPVNLKFSIKNVAKESRFILESNPETDYRLEVKDERGNSMPLTEYGKQILSTAEEVRLVIVKMKPGEEIEDTIQVNRIVKMIAPGTYYITAKRRVPKTPHNRDRLVYISSNTVMVVITPK
jgi:hypothetical protein